MKDILKLQQELSDQRTQYSTEMETIDVADWIEAFRKYTDACHKHRATSLTIELLGL